MYCIISKNRYFTIILIVETQLSINIIYLLKYLIKYIICIINFLVKMINKLRAEFKVL
jgi:hypothetical protein